MCIRDRVNAYLPDNEKVSVNDFILKGVALSLRQFPNLNACLLYTSDAADEGSSVDLGGRRIIKKKTNINNTGEKRSKKATRTKQREAI